MSPSTFSFNLRPSGGIIVPAVSVSSPTTNRLGYPKSQVIYSAPNTHTHAHAHMHIHTCTYTKKPRLGVSPLRAGTHFRGLSLQQELESPSQRQLRPSERPDSARRGALGRGTPSLSPARAAGPSAHAQASLRLLSRPQNCSRRRPWAGAGRAPRFSDWQEDEPIVGEGRGRAASREPGSRPSCSRECAARAGRLL